MIANALAASLTCFTQGFTAEQITNGLKSFFPSVEQTPGRLNIYDFPNFKVMVDFAHNPEGFSGIRDFLSSIDSPHKIGIITGTGDRPDESIIQLGELSAEMFDHIIIHQAKFLRGRSANAIVDLLIQGIQNFNPSCSYEFLPDHIEPLQYAIKLAKKDSFITALSDVLNNPIELIKQYQESYFELK
jgi:cyanophycin synthetase